MLRQRQPVIVHESQEQSFFVLLPPTLYAGLFEFFRDMRDSEDLRTVMQQKDTEWHDWKDVRRELSA